LSFLARPVVRLTLLGLVLVGLLLVVRSAGGLSRAGIEQLVDQAGPLAPLAFVVLYAVLTVMLVPGSIITAAGGLLFGALLGTALTVVGATAGATAAFLLARSLGRRQVEQLAGQRLGRFDRWLEDRGFVAVLYLRLIPVVPFNLSNYVVGVTGVRLGAYVLATALGILPATFAFASLGGNIDDPTSPQFLAAAALLGVLVVAGPLVQRWLRQRGHGPPHDSDDAATNRADRDDTPDGTDTPDRTHTEGQS
jgi:uncharacterized membrane protein YdjX (TVP38/TMEM64 family)